MTYDPAVIEERWQQAWEAERAFESEPAPGTPKFFITVPYPYISGSLHIGHARVVTEADVVARFQRMRGHNTLFPIAFHISGTPVLGISLAIKAGDQKKIDLYRGYVRTYVENEEEVERVVQSFGKPENIVEFFIPRMIQEFRTLGLSVDWRRSFTSGDFDHQALVEWQFRKYRKLGYLVQGKYPILYSLTLKNAVGEDDIAQGDTQPVETQEFTLIRFPMRLRDHDVDLVAATLRPETMFGQTNLWVNPETLYAIADVDGRRWVVSQDCLVKLQHQDHAVAQVGEIRGDELVGKYARAPFVERDIVILPSAHCDPQIGTGIVTSVPGDAPFDLIALQELQNDAHRCARYALDHAKIAAIEPIAIIESKGYGPCPAVDICKKLGIKSLRDAQQLAQATQEIYKVGFHTGRMLDTCGAYAGMMVAQAKQKMREHLIGNGTGAAFYETNRKAQSRDGGQVIVAILDDQWFLDFNSPGWKSAAGKALAGIELAPEKYRAQFRDTFEWLDKRPCARRRGLGTKLPFDPQWVIESLSDSTLYMALYPIAHRLRILGMTKERMSDALFDFVMRGEGDASIVARGAGIPEHELVAMRKEWEYWYPFDQRHTFTAHLSNHLSFMIFAHAACLMPERAPRRISFHGMIVSEGEKMSKSKGNVITLVDIKQRFGADAFRAFMCASTSVESTFDWRTDLVDGMRRHLSAIHTVLSAIQVEKSDGEPKDRALVSRIERCIAQATGHLDAMRLREYSTVVLYEMLAQYRRAVRDADEPERRRINGYIGNRWTLLLAPLVPHLAEELWSLDAGNQDLVSVMPWPAADASRIDERSENDQEYVDETIANARRAIQAKGLSPSTVTLTLAQEWKHAFMPAFKRAFATVKDPKHIAQALAREPALSAHAADVQQLVFSVFKNQKLIPAFDRTHEQELELLQRIAPIVAKELGCDVRVAQASDAKTGLPGRPGIGFA